MNQFINSSMTHTIKKRRAVSPVLAVVVLLGITVVAGGMVFTTFGQLSSTASESNAISVLESNLQVIKDHGSLSMTIKNIGTKSWESVSINAYKGEVPAVIFYRPASWIVSGTSAFLPSDPVFPSKLVDLDSSSSNAGTVIGIGNLMFYGEEPNKFGATSRTLWPDSTTFCAESYSKISWADAQGDCTDGFQTYNGMQMSNPIEPGKTISPASFILTRQLVNSVTLDPLPHDFVIKGETIVISIIVETADGSKSQKNIQVKAT
jgi:flagellin-like protein